MTDRPVTDGRGALVFGILNVTPDSFSDGGLHADADAAIEHGLALVAEGAAVVDVGGESTRPGAVPVDAAEELRRVLPVVRGLVDAGATVSIDTTRAATAEACLAAGASVVNDVSGGEADARMRAVVAAAGVDYVVMHSSGPAGTAVVYRDVVAEVAAELDRRVRAAEAAGVDPVRIIRDPGIGFAKSGDDGWRLLAALETFTAAGRVLVGASRKRFLGAVLEAPDGSSAPDDARDLATAVVSAFTARAGAWAVRVHDVTSTRVALDVEARLAAAP